MIPSTLQKRVLQDLHAGHPESNMMKSLMRSFFYWQNVDKDFQKAVKLCKDCALPAKAPRGVMVKAMHCGIVVREFVLQSRYYVHFRANTLGKGMNPLILPPAMGK